MIKSVPKKELNFECDILRCIFQFCFILFIFCLLNCKTNLNFLLVNFFIGIRSEDEKEFKFYQIKTSEFLFAPRFQIREPDGNFSPHLSSFLNFFARIS